MIFIYGLGKSGISIVKYFKNKKIDFHCWDDKYAIRKQVTKNFKKIKFVDPKATNLDFYKNIILSPGISENNDNFKKIKFKKLKFKRDLNIYWDNKISRKIIAITGTNGKSTTTKLIGDLLRKNNYTSFVGGNIGKPLLNAFLSKKNFNYHVVELSSFQLEFMNNFNPNVSILLNLSKDHLDRYKNYKTYIDQKKKIFSKNKKGYNVISIDDKQSAKLYKSKNIKNKISFSIYNKNADIYYDNCYIYDNFFYKKRKILINKISLDLIGKFNLQNVLATYIVSKIFYISNAIFLKTIKNYRGLPYRNKLIKKNYKFIVINNSKATNVESTYNSLHGYNNVFLIMGGRAKENNFKKILKLRKRINTVFVYGESGKLIQDQLQSKIKVKRFNSLKIVLKNLFQEIKNISEKTTILFSPACTSYDQYKNFEERGEHFSLLVKNFTKDLL